MSDICPYCGKERIVATSPTTGCCDGERFAAWAVLADERTTYRRALEEVTVRAACGWPHTAIYEVSQSALRWSRRLCR